MKLSFPLFLLLTSSLAPTVSGTCDDNLFTWQLLTDSYGSETSWTLSTQDGVDLVLSGNGYGSNLDYEGEACINDGCYTFVMSDTYGDGMLYGGTYSFAVNGVNEIESGGDFGYSETTDFCTAPPVCDNSFTWQLLTDNYGSETSWTLSTQDGGDLVFSGDGYGSNLDYGGEECINDGCYTFVMSDGYGDGICCSFGEGNYSFAVNGVSEIESGGDFGLSETTDFCTTAAPISAPTPTPTCVDSGTLISYSGGVYSCAQVVEYDSCSNPVAATHCPFSCSACEESACLDSQASWTVAGGTYNCDDVAGLTSDSVPYTIEAACAVVGSTCRATCGYCN